MTESDTHPSSDLRDPWRLDSGSPAFDAGAHSDPTLKLGDLAASVGLRRVHFLAWRDLDDPEAGGSELHANMIARQWQSAGIDVTMRTSAVLGGPPVVQREGMRIIRRAGRHVVFPRAAAAEMLGRHGPRDALVEIWNGMPFFSPLWARGPRVAWIHHVHAEMWRMMLPRHLAFIGETVESRLAPRLYRGTRLITLSESSKRELVDDLGFRDELVSVVPPGIDLRFKPPFGGSAAKSPRPLVVAVGRLAPVKAFDELMRVLVRVKERHPELEAMIVGDGIERQALERLRRELGADAWLHLPGRVDDDELVAIYQRAWMVVSASVREGWGMTITEAAACGTPAVATRIPGHADAIEDEWSGLLADTNDELGRLIDRVIVDADLRTRLRAGALAKATGLTWEATAFRTLELLAKEVHRDRSRRRSSIRPGA